jgi:hypothetical protein
VPNIPSRFQSNAGNQNMHTIVLAYVPTAVVPQPPNMTWPLVSPAPFATSPPLQRLKMWCCGDRQRNRCKVGPRSVVPCGHETTVITIGTVYAYNRQYLNARHREINVVDPSLPRHLNGEMADNRHQ